MARTVAFEHEWTTAWQFGFVIISGVMIIGIGRHQWEIRW